MGMEQTVIFAEGSIPAWPMVRELLNRRGFPVHMRMIDGELAFPEEMPPDLWRELRLGTPQGMVTVRRQQDRVVLVTWGNADAALRQAWNALVWAFAQAGGGRIESPQGPVTAGEFLRLAELPESLRGA